MKLRMSIKCLLKKNSKEEWEHLILKIYIAWRAQEQHKEGLIWQLL